MNKKLLQFIDEIKFSYDLKNWRNNEKDAYNENWRIIHPKYHTINFLSTNKSELNEFIKHIDKVKFSFDKSRFLQGPKSFTKDEKLKFHTVNAEILNDKYKKTSDSFKSDMEDLDNLMITYTQKSILILNEYSEKCKHLFTILNERAFNGFLTIIITKKYFTIEKEYLNI